MQITTLDSRLRGNDNKTNLLDVTKHDSACPGC
jgi:hypothetical protein